MEFRDLRVLQENSSRSYSSGCIVDQSCDGYSAGDESSSIVPTYQAGVGPRGLAPASRLSSQAKILSRRSGRRRTGSGNSQGGTMLYWALMFLVVAMIAAVLGFTGIAIAAAGIAKLLFFIFLVLFVITLVAHLGRRGNSGI
jgi:uncharacterized membrane protein YtjA (UPF0391 family)